MKKQSFNKLLLLLSVFLFNTTIYAQFTEGFEGAGIPAGWTVLNLGDPNQWEIDSTNGFLANSGSGYAYIMFDQTIAHDDYLITTQITVTAETSDQLRFFSRNLDINYPEEFNVLISTTGFSQSDFTTTLDGPITPPASWTEYIYDLSDYIGQDIYIAFQAISVNDDELFLDDVSIEAKPSCPSPKELAITSATTNSADVTWTEKGSATTWNIEYGISGFTQGTGTLESGVTNNPHTLTGLTSDTEYEFYVQADCGGSDLSAWTGPFTFSNYYCQVSTNQTVDYFSEVTSSGAETDISYTASSQPVGSYADETAQTFETFEADSFDIETNYVSTNNGVNIWIDWNNNFVFEDSEQVASQYNVNTIKTSTINIPAGTPPGDYRMRIRGSFNTFPPACGSVSRGETIDFTLTVLPLPNCLKPINLDIANISSSSLSVELTWTDLNGASVWNIEYGSSGFTQGSGIMVSGVTSNPHTLTGLSEGLSYEFYVQSDCGGGDESAWAGPFAFTVDYCEVSTTSSNKYLGSIVSSGAEVDISYSATTPLVDSYGDETARVLETYENQEFSIYTVYHRLFTEPSSVQIWVDWNNDYDFEESEKLAYTASNSSGQNAIMTIPTGTPLGDYRMRIRGTSGSHPPACGNVEFGSTVDFTLSVLPSPVCAYPTGLSATNVSQSSVDLGWDANYGVNIWNIEYGEVGFSQGTGTIENGLTTNTYNITGLTPTTDYEFYVQSDCGNSEVSTWSGPFPFFNFYCPVSTTNSIDFMTSIESSGGEIDISYLATSQPAGSYSNETAQTFEAYETQVISINVEYPNGVRGTQAWIDWNGNNDFEESEKVAYTYGVSSSQTLSIPVPAGTPPSDYRMRIRSQSGSYIHPPACGNVPTGSTVDFTLTVVPSPICAHPTGLNITNFTPNTVDLGWNVNYGVSVWNIEYGTAGFTQGTGTLENNITDNTYTMNISPDMEYEFYVQSDCGGGDVSAWEGPFSFDTKYCEVSTSYSDEYFKEISSNGAETKVSYSATVQPPNSYADETAQTFEVFDSQAFEIETEWTANVNTVGIWVDWNSNFEFEADELVASSIETAYTKTFSITVPPGTPEGAYRMRVRSRWGAHLPETCGIESQGSTVDFTLTVIPTPSCLHPTDLNISNISGTSVDLGWMENGTASSWNIEYGEAGFTQGTGTIESGVTNNPYTINILPYKDYDIYVQSNCGGGDLSTWSARYTVNLDYCSPRHVAAPYYITSIVSNGAASEVSYSATTRPTNGYAVDTALLFEAYPNQSFDLITNYFDNKENRIKVWVDWNQDYEFDTTELIDTLISAWAIGEIPVTVPLGTPEGNYRMRVRAWTNPNGMETNPTACETEQLGSSVDLSLKVVTPPTCLSPSAITTSNVTSSSVDIDWTENGSATSWKIEYGPIGFVLGSGTTTSEITSHPYTLSGLSDTTDYEFYVQSDCGINQSSWEGPIQFTTFEECYIPTALTASNFTPNSAEIGWTENGSATSWNIEYGSPGFAQGTGTLENGVSNPHTVTLSPETEYEFYVQSVCGGGNESNWSGPFAFDNMYCEVLANDATHFFTEVKSGGAITNISYTTTTCPPGSYSNETTQVFEVYENQEIFLNTTTNSSSSVVNVWVDWNNNIEFEPTELVASLASSFASKSLLITVPSGTPEGEYRMRIRGRNVYNLPLDPCVGFYFGNSAVDFTLKVVAPPTCLSPSGLVASNISPTSADLEWTESGTATTWNIEYGPSGFTQGSGTLENGVSSPHTIITTPDTKYEFYVQSDCGGGDKSTWSGPFIFQNEYCGASFPNPTDYLNEVTSNGALTDVSYTITTAPANSYVDKTAETFKTYESQTFEINTVFTSLYNNIAIWVDWNKDFTFQSDELIAYVGDESKIDTLSITVPVGTPEGEYRMRVYGDYGAPVVPLPCGGYSNKSIIDFTLSVVATPSCLPPSGLTATNITSNSADLGWTENGTATSWNIEYGEVGFTQGTGTLESGVTNNPYTLSGLTPDNSYEFYVQSDCGGGDESTWKGPFAFDNMYCGVSTASDSYYITSIFTTGAVSNISYSASVQPAGSYSNETTQTFEAFATQTFEIETIYNAGDHTMRAWIDWNNDLGFDPSEMVAIDSIHYRRKRMYITVPAGTPEGNYRMRVRGQTWSVNSYPCDDEIWGSTVDFTLSVVAPPSCLSPTDLTISNETPNTLDLGWTEPSSATEWQIEYGPTGFIQGTGSLETVVGQSLHQFSFNPGDEFDFYVRSICGASDTSYWSVRKQYKYCDVSTYSLNLYLKSISSNGAISNISYSTNSIPLGSYANETAQTLKAYESQTFDVETIYSDLGSKVKIWVDWNQDMIFDTNEMVIADSSISDMSTLSVTIPVGTPPGSYRMRIRGSSDNITITDLTSCENVLYGSTVDFKLTVVPLPCLPPSTLTASNISTISADLGWTENGTATQWNIEFSDSGFVQGSGVLMSGVTNNPYILTGLISNTAYEFYVQADCGGNESTWEGPFSFNTLQGPSQIIITDIGADTAVVVWTDNSSATDWGIEYGLSGFTFGTGTVITTTDNPYVITGLSSNTTYDVYIWANWDGGMIGADGILYSARGTSLMVGPIAFTTQSCISISLDSATVCLNQPIDLDSLLNLRIESQGTWLDQSGSPLVNGEIISSSLPGSYDYSYVVASGACIGETLVVEVTVDQGCDYLSIGMETMKDISVYPNPTSRQLNIVNPSNVSSLKLEMLDMKGRVVMIENNAFNNSLETTLEIGQLAKGVYTLRVYNDEGQKIFKIVKQ